MTSSHPIVVEPNQLFRQSLKHLLSSTCFKVGAEFNTVKLALEAGDTGAAPDLMISGQSVTDEANLCVLREVLPTARIVVLTDDLSVDVLRDAMCSGADGLWPIAT